MKEREEYRKRLAAHHGGASARQQQRPGQYRLVIAVSEAVRNLKMKLLPG